VRLFAPSPCEDERVRRKMNSPQIEPFKFYAIFLDWLIVLGTLH
jgi:hypothetical protein